MKKLLKGGRVVDPANGRDGAFDILIDGDRIAKVGKDLPVDGARLWADLMALAEITEPGKPYTRRSFSALFLEGRRG